MEDAQAVPPGTRGTVLLVDDMGTIHVNWENGSSLGICPDVDSFRKVDVLTARKTLRKTPDPSAARAMPVNTHSIAQPIALIAGGCLFERRERTCPK